MLTGVGSVKLDESSRESEGDGDNADAAEVAVWDSPTAKP
jgi:hypothetical protein